MTVTLKALVYSTQYAHKVSLLMSFDVVSFPAASPRFELWLCFCSFPEGLFIPEIIVLQRFDLQHVLNCCCFAK